jgi:hypothetical protein
MKMKILASAVLATIGVMNSSSIHAENILVVQGEGEHEQVAEAINSFQTGLINGGNTVTIVDSVVSGDLPNYNQVWSIRPLNILSSADSSAFTDYLNQGGKLILSGEHGNYSGAGNASLASFIESKGGGELNLVTFASNDTQTLTDGTQVTYGTAGASTNSGTGEFLSTNNTDGSAIVWDAADLGLSAADAKLAMILDINYHTMDLAGAQSLLKLLGIEFGSLDPVNNDAAIIDKQESVVEATSETALKAQVTTVMNVVASHFKQLRSGSSGQFAINNASYAPASGISAGDGVAGLALWFTPTYSSSNNTQTTDTTTHYNEKNLSYLAGVDYVLNTKTVIGAMGGYEDSSADLKNGGDTEKDGLVFSVYGAYNWSNETTWYAQVGHGLPDNKIKDLTSGTAVTAEFDSKKSFFGIGALYTTQYNDFVVTLDGGFNWAKEDPKSYIDSANRTINAETTKVRLLNVNYEIAKPYAWGEGFIAAGLEYDSINSSTNNSALAGDDQLGGRLGAGLRFNASDNLFGEVSANYNVMRTYEHGGHTFSATLRYTL